MMRSVFLLSFYHIFRRMKRHTMLLKSASWYKIPYNCEVVVNKVEDKK